MTTAADSWKWEIAAVGWTRVHTLLDEGWEPFSVVQRKPNSGITSSEVTVYLRRQRGVTTA